MEIIERNKLTVTSVVKEEYNWLKRKHLWGSERERETIKATHGNNSSLNVCDFLCANVAEYSDAI
jgi:hypothetical protein